MADPRQSHNHKAIDLGTVLQRLLDSTLNHQSQNTTLPSFPPSLRKLPTERRTGPPGLTPNKVLIPDVAPTPSAQDIVVSPDDKQPHPSRESQSTANEPDVRQHQHSLSDLQDAPAISDSPSSSSAQSHLFSTPDPFLTSHTPPSSAIPSIASRPSVRHDSCQTTPCREWNATTCKRCDQRGHTAADHCNHCNATDHVASDHCSFCAVVGHRHSAHCILCRRLGNCRKGYCENAVCERCGEAGHYGHQHCMKCGIAPHSIADHCQVCDTVYCHADRHCNVCEDVGHTSKDHCGLCRDFGHHEDDHCLKCKRFGHGILQCLESDPVSVELCWTCRSYGHNRHECQYRDQDELRFEWAYKLKRVIHDSDYCICCRKLGDPRDRHKFVDCPKMTRRVGCLEKTHGSPKCIEWMKRSRKKKYDNDASTQANLAEYSTDIDPRTLDKGEEKTTVPEFHPPPNIFTVTSSSTQTAFVEVGADVSDLVNQPLDTSLTEQSPIDQTETAPEDAEEEVQHHEAAQDLDYGFGSHGRSVGHHVNLQNELEEDHWDESREEVYGHTDPQRAMQGSASQWDYMQYVYSSDDDLEIIPDPPLDRSPPHDRSHRQRNARTDMPQRPKNLSNRRNIREDIPSADDDPLIVRNSSLDRSDRERNPSPEQNIKLEVIHTNVQCETGNLSPGHAVKEEGSSKELEISTVRTSPPEVPRCQSPIMTTTQIREEYVSPHIIRHVDEYMSFRDVSRTSESSRQTTSNKRPRNSRPSKISIDKRHKTNADPPKLCLSTTVTPEETIDELSEGVWLDSELHIQWKNLCYMAIFEAPKHSTNLRQLHNLVSNWLRNIFRTHTSIHDQAEMHYLETIMRASPHIKSHERSKPSKNPNPIGFSIRKNAIAEVEVMVKAFRIDLATFKYQMCMLKYRPPGTKPRPAISFENLIGMALHQADTRFLSQEKLAQWIEANVPGYDCDGWVPWMEEELFASSFFKRRNSGKKKDQWTFRKGCEGHFDKWQPAITLTTQRDPGVASKTVRKALLRKQIVN